MPHPHAFLVVGSTGGRQMLWWSGDHPALSAGTALHCVRAPCRLRATADNRSPRSNNLDSPSHRIPIWCHHVVPPGQLQFVLAHSRL